MKLTSSCAELPLERNNSHPSRWPGCWFGCVWVLPKPPMVCFNIWGLWLKWLPIPPALFTSSKVFFYQTGWSNQGGALFFCKKLVEIAGTRCFLDKREISGRITKSMSDDVVWPWLLIRKHVKTKSYVLYLCLTPPLFGDHLFDRWKLTC